MSDVVRDQFEKWRKQYEHEMKLRHNTITERVKTEVPKLRTNLLSLGAAKLVASYNGEGDSGSLEEVALVNEKGESFPIEDTNIPDPTCFNEKLEQIFYDLLEVRYAGWENNDGAYGHFEWDLVNDTVTHIHNERIMNVETHTHEGW